MGVTSAVLVTTVCSSYLIILMVSFTSADSTAGSCPFHYTRHSLDELRSKAKRPYLFGGIYDKSRLCLNCNRGGLWSHFCGFRGLEKVPFWHMQICNSSTIDAIVERSLKQKDAAEVLTMTPCDLWAYMRGRTTWIIGDSMSKDLFKALRCFMIEFQDLKTYHASDNYTAMHFLGTIPGHGEPYCIHMPDKTRLCQVHAIEGDLFVDTNRTQFGGVLPLIQRYLALPEDIFVINFGLWHGETRQEAYKTYLTQFGQYYQKMKGKFPHTYFMETPKQHFDSEDGDFKVPWLGKRKGPWVCQPIKGVSMDAAGRIIAAKGNAVADYVAKGSWRNMYAREILGKKFHIPIVPIYNVTVTAWQFHRSNLVGKECSHFCHPSLPQLWVWAMFNTFRQQKLRLVQDPSKSRLQPGCAHVWEWEERKFGSPIPADQLAAHYQRPRNFWDWLFGRHRLEVQLRDGVLVPTLSRGRHSETLTPWEGLGKLLGQSSAQVQQQPQAKKEVHQERGAREQQQQPSQQQHHHRPRQPPPKKEQQQPKKQQQPLPPAAVQQQGKQQKQQQKQKPVHQERGARQQPQPPPLQQPSQQQHDHRPHQLPPKQEQQQPKKQSPAAAAQQQQQKKQEGKPQQQQQQKQQQQQPKGG